MCCLPGLCRFFVPFLDGSVTAPMANPADILRYIDSIARDKEIDKEALLVGIEQAMTLALAKKYGVALQLPTDAPPPPAPLRAKIVQPLETETADVKTGRAQEVVTPDAEDMKSRRWGGR